MNDAKKSARSEFELLTSGSAIGTSKLYSLGDFLPLDDRRAFDGALFMSKLDALFGKTDGDQFVLRHKKSDFVITAYVEQSGPSFGGAPKFADAQKERGPKEVFEQIFVDAQARVARAKADPILAAGNPVNWADYDVLKMDPAEVKTLREKEHVFMKHMLDVHAPPGVAEVVMRLFNLLGY